jgi:hypothetical protein
MKDEELQSVISKSDIWQLYVGDTVAIYCNVFGQLEMPFRLLIGFIDNLQVVTTLTHNTVTHLQLLHTNLFSLSHIVWLTHSK